MPWRGRRRIVLGRLWAKRDRVWSLPKGEYTSPDTRTLVLSSPNWEAIFSSKEHAANDNNERAGLNNVICVLECFKAHLVRCFLGCV